MRKIILTVLGVSLATIGLSQENVFPENGNVGIGLNNPHAYLHMYKPYNVNNINFMKMFYLGSWGTAPYATAFRFLDIESSEGGKILQLNGNGMGIGFDPPAYSSPDKLYVNGRVGIGTKAPTGNLEVVGDANGGQLVISRNMLVGGEGPGITFTNTINNGKLEKVAGIENQLLNGVVGAVSGSLSFFTIANSAKINAMSVSPLGDVSIGTNDTKGYKFAVAGNMIAESIKVKLQGTWPDFVFAKTYDRQTLQETEKHIKEKGHLPGIPSATEVKNNGIDLGEMNAKLLQKIEELTLHLIDQEKRIKELEQRKGN